MDYRLDNGLEVVLAPDPSAHAAAVNIWYHVGSDHEPKEQRGIAHLAEHLMFEGSANVPPGAHVRHLRDLGVDALNAHTGRHRTRYLTTVAPEGLETVLWLEADRMGFLLEGLAEAPFQRERSVVIRELRERIDFAPYGLAEARLWQSLFPSDHPYHHRIEGVQAHLQAIDFEDARSFISRWYGPSNATLVITGRFDPVHVRELIDRYFGPLEGRAHPSPPTAPRARSARRTVVRHEEPVALRPAVLVGWHAPGGGSNEAVLMQVAAELLGAGGSGGLLRKRLVEDLSLAARVHVRLSEQERESVLRVRAIARPGVEPRELLGAIDQLMQELGRGEMAETDLARARQRLMTRRARALDGAGGLIEAAERIHRSRRGLSPAECVAEQELGARALATFVGEWLDPSRAAVILAVPSRSGREAGSKESSRAGAGERE